MKLKVWFLGLLLIAAPTFANQIKQLRIAPLQDKVRMVFDLESRPVYSYTIDTGKNSFTIDFENVVGAAFSPPKTRSLQGYLTSISRKTNGQHVQVEFGIADGIKPIFFTLPPQGSYKSHRLVIDLTHGTSVVPKPIAQPDIAKVRTPQPVETTNVVKTEVTTIKPAATTTAASKPVSGRVIQMSDLISKEELSSSDNSTADEPDNSPDTSKAVLPSNGEPFIVAIDPGHGGKDPGAIGPDRIYEKNVTLGIGRKLAEMINRQPGMKAIMTRSSDRFIELDERSAIARRNKARLLISIHADSGSSSSVQGASVWILSAKRVDKEMNKLLGQQNRHTELLGGAGKVISETEPNQYLAQTILDLSWDSSRSEGYDIGRKVLKRIGDVAALHKKRPEYASLAVLKAPDIPSLLIETGFITNRQEEKRLASAGYQSTLAQAIFRGVMDYYGSSLPSTRATGTLVKKGSSSSDKAARSKRHVVKRGESLSGIAAQYGVSQKALKQENNLTSGNVLIGQVIRIP